MSFFRKGTRAEHRFLKTRHGFWYFAYVALDKQDAPIDWKHDKPYQWMADLDDPDGAFKTANLILAAFNRPRVYEKGVTLVED